MKKFLVLMMTIAMMLCLVACGGSSGGDAPDSGSDTQEPDVPAVVTVDNGNVSCELPEGYEQSDIDSMLSMVNTANDDQLVKIGTSYTGTTAQEERDDDLAFWTEAGKTDYVLSDDIVTGDVTWYTYEFVWNGNPSFKAYSDLGDGEVLYVDFFEIPKDDPVVMTVLESTEHIGE